ncbi:hypothetical protein [Flavobacterium sp. LHD-85]|uniref:hypothetical protein n=1 Tax=Flavobacterium sp. LHD-85 TaxID=3071410 RepID=UPI0027E069BB|nr:hypothetical protein [Flavobacterium sp. LHD-85]MDQ6530195.1 hypothetical protein [Flavobacterium sp. LHD-85]
MTSIISILIPFLSAIFGGYITFYFASKSKKEDAIIKFREEKYANLLILLKGFVGETANYQTKLDFFDEQYRSWIYSSDEVVIALNELVQLIIDQDGKAPDVDKGRKAIGKIVLAMRKDLLKNTSLIEKDFRYTDVRVNT